MVGFLFRYSEMSYPPEIAFHAKEAAAEDEKKKKCFINPSIALYGRSFSHFVVHRTPPFRLFIATDRAPFRRSSHPESLRGLAEEIEAFEGGQRRPLRPAGNDDGNQSATAIRDEVQST